MSVIYEVNIDIEESSFLAYLKWVSPHMDEVVKAGNFLWAKKFSEEKLGAKPPDLKRRQIVMHYAAVDLAHVEEYIKTHAPRLRDDAEKHFGGKFIATRRLLSEF